LERNPAFRYAVRFSRAFPLGDFPVARLYARKARAEHFAHLIAAFHGLDVPGEVNELAPVACQHEHPYRGVDIACRKRRIKLVKKGLNARVKRGVEHHLLPVSFLSFSADVATYPNYLMNQAFPGPFFPAGFCRPSLPADGRHISGPKRTFASAIAQKSRGIT